MRKKSTLPIFLKGFSTTAILLIFSNLAMSATWYVEPAGDDANTGDSWAQAYLTVQKAIESAAPGDEIRVAAGTYLPTKDISGNANPADSRNKIFFIHQ